MSVWVAGMGVNSVLPVEHIQVCTRVEISKKYIVEAKNRDEMGE